MSNAYQHNPLSIDIHKDDKAPYVTPNICQAILCLAQANGVVTFNCQLDADHQGKQHMYTQEDKSGNLTQIYWLGDSRQEEWENTQALLSAHMKNPPTIEQIASWLPAMVSEARGWALWQTYMSKASQTYKKPEWLGE